MLHGYCFNILREAYWDSIKIQLLDVCGRLKQEFKLLPEKYSIVSEIEKDENSVEKDEIIQDIKAAGTIKDFMAIPNADEIIKLESYSPDEMDDMLREFNGLNFKVTKAFQKELDSVVHPNDEYSSSDAHHQPHFTQAEDLEHSIREMFIEYKHSIYKPEQHEYNPLDKDSTIYNMNTYHDFNGCIKYDIFTFKLLTYFTMLYRVFKLEYFIWKSSSKTLDILELEKYVYNGADYWKMNEKADINVPETNIDFEIYSESDNSRANQNNFSKAIIKNIVTQRRRRAKLQDDLENLYERMTEFKKKISAVQDKNMDSILEYISLFQDNKFNKVIYCIDKSLDRLYSSKITYDQEHSVMKQINAFQVLKKKLANRDKRYIPWFNYRFFLNYSEYYLRTNSVINEQAMSPKEIKKLEDCYSQMVFSKNVFSGQKLEQAYGWLDYELLDLPKETRAYILTSSNTTKGFIADYIEYFKLSTRKDSVNLRDKNDILKTFIMRNQLKAALFTWYTMEDFPLVPQQHQSLLLKFRDDLFKKIFAQKQAYLKSIEGLVGPTKLDTTSEEALGVMTPLEKEKLKIKRTQALAKYTLIEQVSQAKAETIVIRDEIDK